MNHDYKSILKSVGEAQLLVLTTHVNPDGDAIGSVLAMYHALTCAGKIVRVILPSAAPPNLQWMPGADVLEVFEPSHETLIANADVVVVMDLNDVTRLKALGLAVSKTSAVVVNIDHHTFPKDFAAAQWIDTDAAATCAMLDGFIRELFENSKVHPAPFQLEKIAMCLYVGIMTDTGSFRFPRTTAAVHRIVARLIEEGADPVKAYELIMNTSSPARTKLLGSALSSLEFYEDGKLCIMTINVNQFKKSGCSVADLDGFVHHATASAGVLIGILIVELETEIKCSLRSKGAYHIRGIAAKYGGGGHNYASGVRMVGIALDVVRRNLIEDCISELNH
ncbi:MAG: bifunctional oligoribonuclease/PAP phosphatase NrnA [Ignavibacteria bacterium]|nr:bifunctional oligoribonuclease/PAP phosphatase NrnA [Ignavibacteria bacterium]